jgi:hypothetical protein
MILFLTPETVRNRDALQLRRIGERRLGRGLRVMPKQGLRSPVFWRLLIDQALPRYLIALSPFPLAMILRPDLALAISQAPLLMFGVVYWIESRVLSVPSPDARRKLIDPDELARRLDLFRLRAREALARIAAGRRMQTGVLHLVVEQSAMRHVEPLTFVSVQVEPMGTEPPQLLALTAAERGALAERLFAPGLDERALHLANLGENVFLRDVPLEARSVSAHVRLMALAEA